MKICLTDLTRRARAPIILQSIPYRFGHLLVLASIVAHVHAGPALDGAVTCHLDFERPEWVAFSRDGRPAESLFPELVPGKIGKAAKIEALGMDGVILQPGNLDKAKGSIAFWYKPLYPKGEKATYCLLASGPFVKKRKNSIKIWIWPRKKGSRLRFDIVKGDGNVDMSTAGWKQGEWKHIVCTWDNERGTALAIDGKIVGAKSCTWTPIETKTVVIGANREKTCTAGGLLDEMLFFNVPLSKDQISALYAGNLSFSYAPPMEKVKKAPERLVFHASFDKGFDANTAAGKAEATPSNSVQLVPGLVGNGVQLGSDATLHYAGAGNVSARAGTLSLWLKLNWAPRGNGFPKAKLGPGIRHEFFAVGPLSADDPSLRFTMNDFLEFTGRGQAPRMWAPVVKQMFKDEWHQVVVTWNVDTMIGAVYLDGKLIRHSFNFGFSTGPLDHIVLGDFPGTVGEKGTDGVLDEVALYNYAMTEDQVLSTYYRHMPLYPAILDYAFTAGRQNTLRVKWLNRGENAASSTVAIHIVNPQQKTVLRQKRSLSVAAGQECDQRYSFTPDIPGLYTILIHNRAGKLIKKRELWAIAATPRKHGKPRYTDDNLADHILLHDVDCSQEQGPDTYRDDGECKVVKNKVGTYREATTAVLSGFAYRLTVNHPGKPHWLEVDYPDDAKRTFYVVLLQEKHNHIDAKGHDTIGIVTGGYYPLSMRMRKKALLFWPDSTNIMVGAYSYYGYKEQRGPALARIRIVEHRGPLPVLKVNEPDDGAGRELAVWQEDPSMPSYAWFNQDTMTDHPDLSFWHTKYSRIIDYLQYTGHNVWTIMCSEYAGDMATDPHILPGSWRWSSQGRMPGWSDVGVLMLEREGIDFFVSSHDRCDFGGGRKKYLGFLQKLLGPLRSRDMFEVNRRGTKAIECIRNDNVFVEDRLNPLHPDVQDAYLKIVRAYVEKFGRYDHFKGIHFLASRRSSLLYMSSTDGYGDYNSRKFEQDTGIRIPVSGSDRKRFAKRYAWLQENAWDRWVDWRCGAITDFYRRLRDAVQQGDTSRSLLISLRAVDPIITWYEDWPLTDNTIYNHWKECGIDFTMLANEQGMRVMPAILPHRGRVFQEGGKKGDRYSWRSYNLSTGLSPYLKKQTSPAGFVNYGMMEVLPWNPRRIPSYWCKFGAWGGQVNGPHHMFTIPHPPGNYTLEHLTHILAEFDAHSITHGLWGPPDTGIIAELRPFFMAYRALPAVTFADVPGANDPVKVRTHSGKGACTLYLVNRQSYPVGCRLHCAGVNRLIDQVTGKPVPMTRDGDVSLLSVTIEPYQLLVLKGAGAIEVRNAQFSVPARIEKALKDRLSTLAGDSVRADTTHRESLKRIHDMALEHYRKKEYSRVHYLLQSGPVLRLYKN